MSSWRPPVENDDGQKEDVSTRSGNNFGNYLDIESAENEPKPTRSHAIKAVEEDSNPNPNVSFQTDDLSRLDLTNHDHLRRYIKLRSSTLEKQSVRSADNANVDENVELSIDKSRLYEALKDAGQYAYGILCVECWTMDEDDGRLRRAEGGYWRSPNLGETPELKHLIEEEEPPQPTMPGVGLAGILWSTVGESVRGYPSTNDMKSRRNLFGRQLSSVRDGLDSSRGKLGKMMDRSTGKSRRQMNPNCGDELNSSNGKSKDANRLRRRSSLLLQSAGGRPSMANLANFISSNDTGIGRLNAVTWRDLKTLQIDPDTPKGKRLEAQINAGFGQAAGIPFESWDCKGIVLFFAAVDEDCGRLSSVENQVWMTRATELIGSILATRNARRASVAFVQATRKQDSIGSERVNDANTIEEGRPRGFCRTVETSCARRVITWAKKCAGGDAQIPPPMPFQQSLWTLLGVFCGLILLSAYNEQISRLSNEEYFLLIGPFGALMTLQYGLTSAPASQPRNAILGQALAGAVSLSFTYIPEEILPTWIRRAIAPAFAITAMVKFGVPHPPAGAHSVIFASGEYGWRFYLLVVLGSILSVIPATLVNNLSAKRAYPIFWGYLPRWIANKWTQRTHNAQTGK